MDLVNHIVFVVGLGISRLLEPGMGQLEQFNLMLRQQLSELHVAFELQGTVLTVGWALVLLMVFRLLRGTFRIVFVLLVAVVLAKLYGVLPPA